MKQMLRAPRRRGWGLALMILVLGSGVWSVSAQGDLAERVERLFREGRYDLARDLIDDHERQGQALGSEVQWWRARLETEPDRYDRRMLELANRATTSAQLVEATLGRAREHFARGRYRTAAELLSPLAEDPRSGDDGRVRLWLGMAEQASGQVGRGMRHLRAVDPDDPVYGTAQALLADLALRAGRLEAADEHARAALAADSDVGPVALVVLGRAAEARGDVELAEEFASRLRREHPASTEAAWRPGLDREESDEQSDGTPTSDVLDAERRSFALQFGAFRDRSLALRLLDRVAGEVDQLRIEVDRTEDTPLYRVVGGSFVTRAQAEAAQGRLRGRGLETLVLAPARGGR